MSHIVAYRIFVIKIFDVVTKFIKSVGLSDRYEDLLFDFKFKLLSLSTHTTNTELRSTNYNIDFILGQLVLTIDN